MNLDYDSLVARVRRFQSRGAPQYEPIPIKEELTPGELAFVDSHKDAATFPELEVVRVQHRLYPRDGMAAHVIGYVGEISEAELDTPEFARFHQGDIIGKDGIEREYNDQLMGVDGAATRGSGQFRKRAPRSGVTKKPFPERTCS